MTFIAASLGWAYYSITLSAINIQSIVIGIAALLEAGGTFTTAEVFEWTQ